MMIKGLQPIFVRKLLKYRPQLTCGRGQARCTDLGNVVHHGQGRCGVLLRPGIKVGAREPDEMRGSALGTGTGAACRSVEESHLPKRHTGAHRGQSQALVGWPLGRQRNVT